LRNWPTNWRLKQRWRSLAHEYSCQEDRDCGLDVLEQPLEVKKRIGYLPETPPIYPEMETEEYLRFVGKLKGLSGSNLQKRIDHACDRCAVADVKKKLLGKLSKGYRQRVGLAQAIIHNPDVLILDEPAAGLDPKQINETRDLIKTLAGAWRFSRRCSMEDLRGSPHL
jgi:gliding motility-associated transport system ATP-binding protein